MYSRVTNSEADGLLCSQWVSRIAEKNLVDPDVFGYPATRVWVAYDQQSKEPQMFVPVQMAFVLESLAPKPETEGMTEAEALKSVLQGVVAKAHEIGIGEIYFLCQDEDVIRIAEKNGFTRSTLPLLRMKL